MSEKPDPPKAPGPAKPGPPKFAPLKGVKVRAATVAERESFAPPQESAGDITSIVVAPLFPVAKKAAEAVLKPGGETSAAPAKPEAAAVAAVPKKTEAPKKERVTASQRAAKEEAAAEDAAERVVADVDIEALPEPLQALAKPIIAEDYGNPYVDKKAPAAYVPTTRRGFSEFIETAFRAFALPPPAEEPDFEQCAKQGAGGATKAEIYLYQQFIREYMRQESPYRGILVYHGLGSGKTCSAIATAEALFSSARKKIVVMTPFSLRKNFLKEITFCGFQHFRFENFWVPLDIRDATVKLFATEVYGLPAKYEATTLWVPDFSKKDTPNYRTLSAKEQTEIRTQVYTLINARIQFINYNGISAARLKEFACRKPEERPFDNAVIVIDEVHNLIRLMQGTIEPYLAIVPQLRRKINPEPVKPERWRPGLCGKAQNYKRGYLFYRLLLDAQNSKIVALSGTPLINFPEELGILANVLHGYIPVATLNATGTDPAALQKIEQEGIAHPYIDFIRVTPTPTGATIVVTPLPAGTRKKRSGTVMEGVERIPAGQKVPSFEEIVTTFQDALRAAGIRISADAKIKTEPLLPPFGQAFREIFLNSETGGLQNENVLAKRLTGLISYYKGSKEVLMPKVTRDELVRCEMSVYQATEYLRVRLDEVKIEEKEQKKRRGPKLQSVWQEVFDVAAKKQTNNYRMGSRQACNFVFPEEVVRPRPRNQREEVLEAGREPVMIIDAALESQAAAAKGEDIPIGDADDQGDERAAEAEDENIERHEQADFLAAAAAQAAVVEDPGARNGNGAAAAAVVAEPVVVVTEAEKKRASALLKLKQLLETALEGGKSIDTLKGEKVGEVTPFVLPNDIDPEVLTQISEEFEVIEFTPEGFRGIEGPGLEADIAKLLNKDVAPEAAPVKEAPPPEEEVVATGKKLTMKAIEEQRARDLADCQAGLKPGENYQVAIERSKRCLKQFAKKKLMRSSPPPDNLQKYSEKYNKMLENIEASPGSNLVYSQFLEMEGIGIFSIAMEANGFVPIEIYYRWQTETVEFSKRTIASLKKGPAVKENRFLKFTGAEPDIVRKYAIDLFNARFSELPAELKTVLEESGWTDNKQGQLCRVFCITSAGAEGISLKNVRRVHIMEPYWNDVRLAQVKGRAVRICSHMDLPYSPDPKLNQRTVEVFTYVSVFPSDIRGITIDESIYRRDTMIPAVAEAFDFPVPRGAEGYVATSDENLYFVAMGKKNIIDGLERIMKSAAVDCRLNTYDNEDGTYSCLTLKGKVGDFTYHPILIEDILESSVAFKEQKADEVAVPVLEKALQIEYDSRRLIAAPVRDKDTRIVLSYDLYDAADKARVRKVGTMTADPITGNPTGEATFIV
jgi:hypothetical protein